MNAAKRFLMVAGAFALATLTFTLANPKAVHAFAATLVQVVNTPDSQPFSTRLDFAISQNRGTASFAVPAGKTLVIDYISSDAETGGGVVVFFGVQTFLNGGEVESHIPMVPAGGGIGGGPIFNMSSPVKIYADGGSTVQIFIITNGADGGGGITGIYGHYV